MHSIVDLDRTHHLHPFTHHRSLRAEGARIIERAEGPYLFDSTGHKLLDGMAGLWNVQLGYGRSELVNAAAEQMQTLPYYNSFFKCTVPSAALLAEKLASLTDGLLKNVMYGTSGSDAVDTAIRLIRHYWSLKGQPNRSILIARHSAYHGSTIAGASLGGMSAMQAQINVPLPGMAHVMSPYAFENQEPNETLDQFGLRAARAIEEKILAVGPDKVAAVVGEPIQGAGGVKIPPETYWPEVQRICRRHDVLLMTDEVICGFGRLGHWFGFQRYGIEPDLSTFAKGVTSGYFPLSGVLVGERVSQALEEADGEFAHGYTYAAHPVGCAVALENIRLLEEEGLVEQVRNRTGPYLAQRLQDRLGHHQIVGEVRSDGFVAAIELVADKDALERFDDALEAGTVCRDACLEVGIVARAVGNTIVLSPPLTWDEARIDEAIELLHNALELTAERLGRSGLG